LVEDASEVERRSPLVEQIAIDPLSERAHPVLATTRHRPLPPAHTPTTRSAATPGGRAPSRRDRRLATALFEHNNRLFTFLEQEGVEPTNNSVERALRTGVQWRKICFGNRSANGELATARLLTVAETCDLQRLNILAYLSAAIVCHRSRQQAASLLHR
jgi:hypothetical protein